MKKIIGVFSVMLVMLSTSCSFFDYDYKGHPVRFGATVERYSPKTRTSFSGEVIDGKERIDWVDGDVIRIYMSSYKNYDNSNLDDYKDYYVVNIIDQGYKSIAQVSPVTDTLTWKDGDYNYRFVGVYPGNKINYVYSDGGRYNNTTIKFNLPNEQNGSMDYSFMAAMTNWYKQGELVVLQFYPMVTTLYFTLLNDTNATQSVFRIELEQKTTDGGIAPLVGEYTVSSNSGGQFSSLGYGWSGTQKLTINVNKPILSGDSLCVPAFIVPENRPAEIQHVDVILGEKRLSNNMSNKKVSTFGSFKKYNIKINLSGSGTEIDPDPVIPDLPPVHTDGLSDGACQFLLGTIESLQEVFRALLGDNFINDRFNGLRKLERNITAEDFYQYLTDDDIFKILSYFQTCFEIELITGDHLNSPITAEDFLRIIPCCRTLTIRAEQETEYWFKDLELLQTIKIEGNGKVIIHADGCSSLTNVTWWDSHTKNGSGIFINGEWHKAQ